MIESRGIRHSRELPAPPERVFPLLHTPSAIRDWWGAARVAVIPETGGLWVATWGAAEDAPDYITAATIQVFEPPRRLVLGDFRYRARTGPLPWDADLTTTFEVEPAGANGSVLRVEQAGFPLTAEVDPFFAACERGWRETFDGIARLVEAGGASRDRSAGPGLEGLAQVLIVVGDLPRAIDFWRDTLGFRLLFEAPPGLAFFDAAGVRLMLSQPEGPVRSEHTSVLYFTVCDIQAAAAELTARGVHFESAPHRAAALARTDLWLAFFRDPDGHLLALSAEVPRPA